MFVINPDKTIHLIDIPNIQDCEIKVENIIIKCEKINQDIPECEPLIIDNEIEIDNYQLCFRYYLMIISSITIYYILHKL